MSLEPVYDNLVITEEKGNLIEKAKVECRTEISTDEVEKVLNVFCRSTVENKNKADKFLETLGKVNCYIAYLSKDGINKCECVSEYKCTFNNDIINENSETVLSSKVVKTEVVATGVNLCVVAYVEVNALILDKRQVQVLTGGENLITDCKEKTVLKNYGVRNISFPVSNEFELDYSIEKVLCHYYNNVIRSVQCGVGSVIVEGDIFLTAIVLQKSEKQGIIREDRTIPYRIELEYEDAMPQMNAVVNVCEKALKTDISVDEENNKSIVSVNATLDFCVDVVSENEYTFITDAFCLTDDVKIDKNEFSVLKTQGYASIPFEITDTQVVEGVESQSVLYSSMCEKAILTESKCALNKLELNGVVNYNALFKDVDGNFFVKKIEFPFCYSIDYNCKENETIDVEVKCCKTVARFINGEIQTTCEMYCTVCSKSKCLVDYISNIECVGQKTINNSAISVYIPLNGEDLWSLAKRLNVSPETLSLTNKELQFPLTGNERIVVYRCME